MALLSLKRTKFFNASYKDIFPVLLSDNKGASPLLPRQSQKDECPKDKQKRHFRYPITSLFSNGYSYLNMPKPSLVAQCTYFTVTVKSNSMIHVVNLL